MTQRSPAFVFFAALLTLGIYSIIWVIKIRNELVENEAKVPHPIYLLFPVLNLIWLWKWAMGIETVTQRKVGAVVVFLLLLFLGPVGMAVVQSKLNAAQAR